MDGVDITLDRGETLSVVGESGAGKSTVGRLILRLIEPDAGRVMMDGIEVTALGRKELRKHRRRMQLIFQDPFSSLDPRVSVGESVAEPLHILMGVRGPELRKRTLDLLDRVGITELQSDRYPHEFSGGQLQRIGIARALAVEPDLIVCDEPVAALDVSIRAQVINLLHDLQQEHGVAYLFISHDLSLVQVISHRIAVMYRGRVVEIASAEELYTNPRHPYTRTLIDLVPVPNPRLRARRPTLALLNDRVSTGCAFAPRCALAVEKCWTQKPELLPVSSATSVACHVEAEATAVAGGVATK
ncbi:ABC transporter ATP-binding protein [Rhodococcus rhodochrous]|uniref:ABC transporter ATP-binding protein n=1 Tax=Rhodococcus rhodochrous TaxID=1829 RepID=UPI0002F24DAC|nr:oligopeptide/dipeptide ABC transporter ATP-binding protein [Rhodococcus rhodochrous]